MNWRPYLLPGLVFQSVIIGGGYATGRELVEFFMPAGPLGGILGRALAAAAFAVVMSVAYEFARIHRAFDYRSFCKHLLGRAWVLYELAYLALVVLILAVVGSAAGEIIATATGLPTVVGTSAMMILVGVLTFFGSAVIGNVFALWSLLLYATYLALFVITFLQFGDRIEARLAADAAPGGWALAGLRYAGYNVNLPAVLFCAALLTRRSQAVVAGIMTGVIAIAPAIVFYLAMLSQYPEINEQPLPVLYLMQQLDVSGFLVVFQLVIFGTFVETGAGVLHSINERLDTQARESGRSFPRRARAGLAIALLSISVFGATRIGIVDLIGRGYGLLSWVFIGVLIVPLMTLGIWRIARAAPG